MKLSDSSGNFKGPPTTKKMKLIQQKPLKLVFTLEKSLSSNKLEVKENASGAS